MRQLDSRLLRLIRDIAAENVYGECDGTCDDNDELSDAGMDALLARKLVTETVCRLQGTNTHFDITALGRAALLVGAIS